MKILVIGTIGFDIIETPFSKTNKILGGSATFISFALSILKIPIYLISIIGSDFPDKYLKIFKSKNINIEYVSKISNEKTFFWHGKYRNDMNFRDTLSTKLNVIKKFEPKIPNHLKTSEIILLGNIDPKLQILLLNQVKKVKLIILDTMNYWIKKSFNLLIKVIKKSNILTINEEEVKEISKNTDLYTAIKKIHNIGPEFIIIKRGENGALLSSIYKIKSIPAFKITKLIDPTGAGDTFLGGLASYLSYKNNITFEIVEHGIIYGNILASFCIEKFGVKNITSIKIDEILDRINKFESMNSYNLSELKNILKNI